MTVARSAPSTQPMPGTHRPAPHLSPDTCDPPARTCSPVPPSFPDAGSSPPANGPPGTRSPPHLTRPAGTRCPHLLPNRQSTPTLHPPANPGSPWDLFPLRPPGTGPRSDPRYPPRRPSPPAETSPSSRSPRKPTLHDAPYSQSLYLELLLFILISSGAGDSLHNERRAASPGHLARKSRNERYNY